MIVDVITIFPGMFEGPMSTSIVGSARERGLLEFRAHDLRDWTHDKHRTTDDYPYGGGPGLVMKPEPIFEAVEAVQLLEDDPGYVVFFTPAGIPLTQDLVETLAEKERLVMVCGRYEGFDERVLSLADVELSIGDYVLTGGELPAMVVVDAVSRHVPGVLGDEASAVDESFSEGLLEYPQYTRPADYRGMLVPEVLLSGDHGKIAAWRRAQAVCKTALVRPDMLAHTSLAEGESALALRAVTGLEYREDPMATIENPNEGSAAPKQEETSTLRWLIETALLVLLAFALAQGIKSYVAQPFIVPTGSMQPTIELRNYVLAEKLTYRFVRKPQYGDIVVFTNPLRDPAAPILIKRCIAVGGQTVDLRDGSVYVDGTKLVEPYTYGKPSNPLNPAIKYPFKVPDGYYWMMGDNRTNSGDSRELGPVPGNDVIGHAVWTYWPFDKFGALH